jgi:hypothetical protein
MRQGHPISWQQAATHHHPQQQVAMNTSILDYTSTTSALSFCLQ